jgi:uncharacterized protein YecE (DUF72 family)
MAGEIRVGVGGWTFEPWRGVFYPEGLPQRQELEFASRKLTSIEINGTYYGSQKPESFDKWHNETPDGFVFAVKGPRFTTNRRVLAEAAPSIERFFASGVMRLKGKLGPINWQLPNTKKLDLDDFVKFIELLPKRVDGGEVRHAIEARHESFAAADFVQLCREHGVAIVIAADGPYPQIADITAAFVYARIMGTVEGEALGYPRKALDLWAERARAWSRGEAAEGMETLAPAGKPAACEVFLYVISGFKPRNPAAAMALIERLGGK